MHKQEGKGPRQELQGAGRGLTRLVICSSQGLIAPSYQVPRLHFESYEPGTCTLRLSPDSMAPSRPEGS